MLTFKRSLVACASLAALSLSGVVSADPVQFNTQTSGIITFNNLVWQAGNALVMGVYSTPPIAGTSTQLIHTVAQARLASFTLTGGGALALPSPAEITYQADFWEFATGIGGATAAFTLAPPPAGFTNSIKVYYQNNAAFFGDDKTGNNYGSEGAATLILQGDIVGNQGNFTNLTAIAPGVFPVQPLDCDANPPNVNCVGFDGIDQAPGTLTRVGNGSQQYNVDVTFQDNSFFLTNVSSLAVDLSQSTGVFNPFNNTNPWINVVNQTPYFSLVGGGGGTRINGDDSTFPNCVGQSQAGNNLNRCDILLQTTGTTTFETVPEPSSMALVGTLLTVAGLASRRRKSA